MEGDAAAYWSKTTPPRVSMPCISTPYARRLSSSFFPVPSAPVPRTVAWFSLQGRLVGAEEATSAAAIGGGLAGREEAVAWELFSPLQRVLLVAVVAAASNRSRRIAQLQRSVQIRDEVLLSMQQKLDDLCEQMTFVPDQAVKNNSIIVVSKLAHDATQFCCSRKPLQELNHENGTVPLCKDTSNEDITEVEKEGIFDINNTTIVEQEERRMSDLSDFNWSVASSVDLQEKPKEAKGTLRVFTDPFQILKEEQAKIKKNIQVSILTRGYENWRNGEANLLVTRGLVGRLSNTPNVGFAYEVQNVVDYLASHGVRALPGRSYNTRDVLGHNWIIRQSTVNIPMQPTEVSTRNMLDGSVSLQFDNYQAATLTAPPRFNSKDEEVQSDEEEIQSHTIAVLMEERPEEELLVKRISSLAQLPTRRTQGAAGYDISITHAQDIPAHGRSLLYTGICIQIPQNTYARIAPRSSAALKGIIIMGGVIDSDYRGKVRIMAFNTTNDDIFLEKQEYIAQLIIEHIATPNVREVEVLNTTPRGTSGFGSTTIKHKCSHTKANPECTGCHYCCSDEEYTADYDEYVAARPQPTQKQKG
ncbi:hypothetical protein ZIOFF_025428 [Zingiber officinale]|uniref:dUTPase-like domain-containing protein n=1 Tax=Zingiber officinale TaxID=94328 RepID=A0A8J5HAZ0_ZINOF|nr:hypothetical protein ZIOFF_025428 [Zingiber officinale]